MKPADRAHFAELLTGVYSVYRAEFSKAILEFWWRAMQGYELAAVSEALTRHAMNPDTGQFIPKPADVVRMLGGTTKDTAILAWAKVLRAVVHVGHCNTVVFDDPIIHRVVEDMGGWIQLCTVTEDETPFVEKRFCDQYRAQKLRGESPEHLPRLLGSIDLTNLPLGAEQQDPVLVGDPWACAKVLESGKFERSNFMTLLSKMKALPAPAHTGGNK